MEATDPTKRDETSSHSPLSGFPSSGFSAPGQHQQQQSASSSGLPMTKSRRIISCISCQQRKVKCDRQDPCAPCVKSRLTCQYRAPVTARRRRKKAPADANLHERLAKLEEILRTVAPDVVKSGKSDKSKAGTGPGASPAAEGGPLSPPASEQSERTPSEQPENIFSDLGPKGPENAPVSEFGTGRMFTDQGKSLYTEKYVRGALRKKICAIDH